MAKIVVRKNLKQFGVNGNSNNYGQFGSVVAGIPLKTKNIDTIQALSAWLTGWQDAVIASNKAPFLEDMNSAMFVMIYELFYLLQEGIPEWDASTTYFVGSRVRKVGTNEVYGSLTDDNLNNALPSQADSINWKFIYPVRFTDLIGSIALPQIPDGLITDAKIISLVASKITGLLTDSQIQSLQAPKLFGRVDGSDPASPQFGQIVQSYVPEASAIPLLIAGQFYNVTSLDLEAGDWDITGTVGWGSVASTNVNFFGALSIFSGNIITDHQDAYNLIRTNSWVGGINYYVSIPKFRVTTTSGQTVYLKARASNTSTKAFGSLYYRRAS